VKRGDGCGQMTTREGAIVDHSRGLGRALAMLDAVCEVLATDRPLKLLLAASLLAACAYCAWLFDYGFLLGTSAFWNNPRGILGNSWADISAAISGYDFFQRDVWQLPLFHVDKLGAPEGINIIFTDSIPWVALGGRLMFRATGLPVNLYGAWTAFCFIASAMSLTALVGTLRQRSLAAAAMATVAGLCMPALLARWGHMSLMAQFEIPLALIFYLRNRGSGRSWWLFAQSVGLTLLALWTHIYIFAMVIAIVFATIVQAVFDRSLRWRAAAAMLAGLAVVLGAVVVLSGHLQSRGGLGTGGNDPFFSMNLLSPFLPQRSGLAESMRDIIVDGNGRQYEGFSYLGGGVLLLLLATVPRQMRTLWIGLGCHPCLWGLFLCCTLFALSNTIYFATLQVLYVPLPWRIMQFASMFRSSGRFFWPVMYCMTALAIAAVIPLYGRRGVLLLCLATALQWIDAAPLRDAVAASTRVPEKPHIHLADWQAAIARHRSIRVLPQNFCLGDSLGWNSHVAVQLQLLAALADRPINSVSAARLDADCAAEQRIDGTPRPGARELSVFLDEFGGFASMLVLAATGDNCRAGPALVVCSDILEEAPSLAALVRTDKQ
jgi:Family of unknown function (DUF6311)